MKFEKLEDSFRSKPGFDHEDKRLDEGPAITKSQSTRGYKNAQESDRSGVSGMSGAGLSSYQQKRANYKAALKNKGNTKDMLDYSLTDIKDAVNKDETKIVQTDKRP